MSAQKSSRFYQAGEFWTAVVLFCVAVSLTTWFHYQFHANEGLANYISLAAGTFVFGIIFGATTGANYQSRKDRKFFTTNHLGMKKLLREFIEHHAPDCAFLGPNFKLPCGPLVGRLNIDHQEASCKEIPTVQALQETCNQIILQIETAQGTVPLQLEPLMVLVSAAKQVEEIKARVVLSLGAAEEEKNRLKGLVEYLQKEKKLPETPLTLEDLDEFAQGADSPPLQSGPEEETTKLAPEELAKKLGLELVDLTQIEFTDELIGQMPTQAAHWYQVMPIRLDGDTLVVAMVDPMNSSTIPQLEQHLSRPVKGAIALENSVRALIGEYYGPEPEVGSKPQIPGQEKLLEEESEPASTEEE